MREQDRLRSGALSRRELLIGSTAALPLGAALWGRQAGARASASPARAEPELLPNLPTEFSTAERDWRWRRVRDLMRQQKFDCLLTPAASGEGGADSQYLAQRGGWIVFPLDGPVVAVGEGEPGWANEAKPAEDGRYSPGIVNALRQLKMERARIGVGRLEGALRNEEGDVTHTTLERVKRALAGARFESATDLLMRVKLVRSQEELRAMELATAAGERGIEAMIAAARPGAVHKDVWLAIFNAMTAATGETPSRLAIRAGEEANTSGGGPLLETVQAGQIMNQEIAARVLGYMAQVNHSICVGRPEPADWRDAARYCVDTYLELVDWIKPGKRFIDLCNHYAQKAKARSPEMSPTWVLVHTCGLGDGPRMGAGRKETVDLVIESTMCFDIKPRIIAKGTKPTVQFGDPVVVTETGARRLGRRKLEPMVVGT
jgi:Xaa-Pro aminopeptidase